VEKGRVSDERLEFAPMQDLRNIKVREDQDTHVTFDTLIELPSSI